MMDAGTAAAFTALTKLMNDQFERVLERLGSLERDFQNTKGFLIEDALTLGRRMSAAERRLDKLE